MKATLLIVTGADALNDRLVQAARAARFEHVERAANGNAALSAFAARSPACVIIDANDPQAAEVVTRAKQRSLGTRVIVCGAPEELDQIEKLLAHGAHEFLLKPFSQAQLTRKLERLAVAA